MEEAGRVQEKGKDSGGSQRKQPLGKGRGGGGGGGGEEEGERRERGGSPPPPPPPPPPLFLKNLYIKEGEYMPLVKTVGKVT